MRLSLITLAVAETLLGFAPNAATADDVGRYQAIIIPRHQDAASTNIFVLDTRDGEMWQLWETPTMGDFKDSRGIVYLGRAIPGDKPGQVIHSQTFGK